MRVGERSPGHQRRDHGYLGLLHQCGEFLEGLCPDHSTADVEHGTLGLRDQPRGRADLTHMGFDGGLVAGQVHLLRPVERGLGCKGILGDVHEHRSGTTRRRDVKGLLHGQGNVLCLLDEKAVLRDRHHDAANVRLLEGIRPDGGGVDLPCDGHEWRGVHVGVADGGHQVGGARSRGRHAHSDAPTRNGIALGRVPGTLLVPNQDVPDAGIVERVIGREDGSSRDAEGHLHPSPFQRLDQRLGACQQLALCL